MELGVLEAMADGLRGRGRGFLPRPGHYSRNLSTPPKKKSMGQLMGYQEPSGAVLRNQGPSQGPSATTSRSATSEAAPNESPWTRPKSLDTLKLFLRTGQDLNRVSGDMARHSWL